MFSPFAFFELGLDAARLGVEMARLGAEANSVIALRMAQFASGDAKAGPEMVRMVTEKAIAAGEANMRLASGAASGNLDKATRDVVKLYRRKVRANRRRLSK